MHDPKFEKDVQQKMEELNFIPSESVWENVEKEIRKEKRRRIPILWFFLLGGIMLAGGYYTFFGKSSSATDHGYKAVTTAGEADKNPSGSDKHESDKHKITGSAATAQPAPGSNVPSPLTTSPDNTPDNRPDANTAIDKQHPDRQVAGLPSISGETLKKRTGIPEQRDGSETSQQVSTGKRGTGGRQEPDRTGRRRGAGNTNGTQGMNKTQGTNETQGTNKTEGTRDGEIAASPAPHIDSLAALAKADPTPSKAGTSKAMPAKVISAKTKQGINETEKTVAASNKMNVPHHWKIGLTGVGGISGIERSLFSRSSAGQLSSFATTFAAYPPGWQTSPSKIRQGFSFAAGIFASRSLTRKLSFTIGLNYHYYSTSIETGPEIKLTSGSNPNSYSLSVSNALPQQSTAQSYSVGDAGVQKGQYHLVELPVALQWQFATIRKLPLYWENGLAVSSLVSSNALHFDGTSGTYHKDNALFKKMQTSISSAVLLGFPAAGHHLLLGPEIQYGFSNLLKNKIGDTQHLLFGGVKLVFMLGK